MNRTNIEYLTHMWNPTHGCTSISEGCRECWAKAMAKRLAGMGVRGYSKENPFKPTFCPWKLEEPLKVKKPSIPGVCFMGDLFHEDIPFDVIAAIFGVMSFCQEHTFLVLTKRDARLAEFYRFHNGNYNSNFNWWLNEACSVLPDNMTKGIRLRPRPDKFPLPNIWLGVTTENQQRWDERKFFLDIPAAKHFISYEPALGPLDLGPDLKNRIDLVIAGCESGSNRRPAKTEWFRDLKDQCVEAGIPYFLKQMEMITELPSKKWGIMTKLNIVKMPFLDGEIWNQMP